MKKKTKKLPILSVFSKHENLKKFHNKTDILNKKKSI